MRRLSSEGGLAAFALVLVCAVGCSKEEPRPAPGPQPGDSTTGDTDEPTMPDEPVEAEMGVARTYEGAQSGTYEASFGLFDVKDLYVGLAIPQRDDVVVVRFDIRLPNAQLYSSFWAAYSMAEDAPASVPHPLTPGVDITVDKAEVQGERMVGLYRFLVRGTPITRSLVTGQFSIEAFEGASDDALLAQTNFELVGPQQ